MEVLTVSDSVLGAPPFYLEVRWVTGSGGCHHFHRIFRGGGVFVSVQQNNNNALRTNPKCNIVKDITNITCVCVCFLVTSQSSIPKL